MSGSKYAFYYHDLRYPEKVQYKLYSQVVAGPHNCIIWTGSKFHNGYGALSVQLKIGSKSERTHRLTYILEKGFIPAGMNIDHLCEVKACVNYQHLELVTPKENARRTPKPRNTCCSRCGSVLLEEDSRGYYTCRPCKSDYDRNYYLRKKAKL